jgi:hypothetical protein
MLEKQVKNLQKRREELKKEIDRINNYDEKSAKKQLKAV